MSPILPLHAIISSPFHGELQRGRTFLDNYVLCRVTNSNPGKTKLETSISSRFDFSAFTLQSPHTPGRWRSSAPADGEGWAQTHLTRLWLHRPSGPGQSSTANQKYTFKVSKMQKVTCFVAKESMKPSLNISGAGASSLRRQHFCPKIKTSKVLLPGITSQCWQGPLFPRECYENGPSTTSSCFSPQSCQGKAVTLCAFIIPRDTMKPLIFSSLPLSCFSWSPCCLWTVTLFI